MSLTLPRPPLCCHHASRYPLLQWQARAARRAAARLAQCGPWLRERLALCRYAAAPLSNLGVDGSVAVADLLLARTLRASGHLLWVRDPSQPDLGAYGAGGGRGGLI